MSNVQKAMQWLKRTKKKSYEIDEVTGEFTCVLQAKDKFKLSKDEIEDLAMDIQMEAFDSVRPCPVDGLPGIPIVSKLLFSSVHYRKLLENAQNCDLEYQIDHDKKFNKVSCNAAIKRLENELNKINCTY